MSKPPKFPSSTVPRRRKRKALSPGEQAAFVDGGIEQLQGVESQESQLQNAQTHNADSSSAQNADAHSQDVQKLMAQVASTQLPDARLHVYVRGDIMVRMKILKSLRPTGQRSLKSMVEEALLAYLETHGA